MNMSTSHCTSSGCESGWTLYLDQSAFTKNQYQNFVQGNNNNYTRNDNYDDEEEDLSMVSDASSGPPHYYEDGEEYSFDQYAKKNKNKKKSKEYTTSQQQHQYSYLDDTASSPVFTKKAGVNNSEAPMDHSLEFSQGYSATHYKGKSSLKKHFGFFKSEKSSSKEQGGYQGRKWK